MHPPGGSFVPEMGGECALKKGRARSLSDIVLCSQISFRRWWRRRIPARREQVCNVALARRWIGPVWASARMDPGDAIPPSQFGPKRNLVPMVHVLFILSAMIQKHRIWLLALFLVTLAFTSCLNQEGVAPAAGELKSPGGSGGY